MRKKFKIQLLIFFIGFGVLFAIVVFLTLGDAKPNDTNIRRTADLRQLEIAVGFYYDANRRYPAAELGCQDTAPLEVLVSPGYIAAIPHDRKESEGHPPYQYAVSADGSQYVIKAVLTRNVSRSESDLDGIILGCDCNDPNFCVGSSNLEI